MQLETLAGVVLDADGAPVSFIWNSRQYTVASRPVRWYSRKLWWQEAAAAPRGAGAALVEIEMWRLWAVSDYDRVFLEMKHLDPEDSWEIHRIDS
ncbi:MAG: hypothetical protein VWZ99_04205 [Aquiluna sp.]|jgi:hypothetical protein